MRSLHTFHALLITGLLAAVPATVLAEPGAQPLYSAGNRPGPNPQAQQIAQQLGQRSNQIREQQQKLVQEKRKALHEMDLAERSAEEALKEVGEILKITPAKFSENVKSLVGSYADDENDTDALTGAEQQLTQGFGDVATTALEPTDRSLVAARTASAIQKAMDDLDSSLQVVEETEAAAKSLNRDSEEDQKSEDQEIVTTLTLSLHTKDKAKKIAEKIERFKPPSKREKVAESTEESRPAESTEGHEDTKSE